jgi:uncharacterized protein
MLTQATVLSIGMALVVGTSLGLLGGGGSILIVPLFVYGLGMEAKPAVAMSLAVVSLTSLVGAVLHWRLGNVRLSTAALFSGLAMAGAFAGARLSAFVSGRTQLMMLALVMFAAGASMLRRVADKPRGPSDSPPHPTVLVSAALGVGLLTGLVGVGGGFLIVPALVVLVRMPMRQAVGTSLVVIALNSAAGFVGYLPSVSIDLRFLTAFAAVAAVGVLGGAIMTRVVAAAALRRSFAVLLLVAGGFLLSRNVGALGDTEQASAPARLPSSTTTR